MSERQPVDWIQRLRDLRRLLGWSQRRLAREFLVTPGAVSQWESGQRSVPGPVQRLIEIYEQSLGMLDAPQAERRARLNSSWAARTLRTATTTAAIAARLTGSSMAQLVVSNTRAAELKTATHRAIATKVAETLGEMNGLAMKLGQLASLSGHALPEAVREALQSLQQSGRPMSPATVEQVFLESMHRRPGEVFARFCPEPFAAASIGQVHRAQLADGTDVAVKVQYPHIRPSIAADLKNLEAVDRLACAVFRGQQPGTLLAELTARLTEECDYLTEARNQQEFAELHAGTAGVMVPAVFPGHSTERILTTTLVRGRRFVPFVRTATQEARDRAGETIFRFTLGSVFAHGIFNADPHPGNYLFPASGEVAFVDFGCVKRFSADFLDRWRRYARAVVEERRAEADELVVALGFVPDPDRFDFDYQYEVMRQVYEPFWRKPPFRFNRDYVARTWRGLFTENLNKLRINIPADFLFVTRLQWGLHFVLAELEAQADWRALFREHVFEVAPRGARRGSSR